MARHLHIHIHAPLVRRVTRDRQVVYDADQPTPFEELVARLMEILQRVEGTNADTKDDAEEGHPFYGNQYTKVAGLGEKPTSATAKGTKAALHELFTSGHSFSFEELMKATGAKSENTLKTCLAMINNPKWTPAHHLLQIQKSKETGHYSIVHPDGTKANPTEALETPSKPPDQAVATPKAEAQGVNPSLLEQLGLAGAAPPAGEPPAKAPEPATPPAAEPPATEGAGFGNLPSTWTLSNEKPEPPTVVVPDVKMSKELADQHYQTHIDHTVDAVIAAYHDHGLTVAAHTWKLGKAQAMAQWATNYHGTLYKPKPVEVFNEDKTLVDKLVTIALDHQKASMADQKKKAVAEALAQWKADTAAAKMKPATPPVEAKKEEPKVEAKKEEPPAAKPPAPDSTGAFKPVPKQIVPDDHKHIGPQDFAGGPSANAYAKNILAAKKMMVEDSKDAVANKVNIASDLTKALKDSPHFEEVQQAYAKKSTAYSGTLAAQLVSNWAGSSGGHHPGSCSMQLCVRDLFGMQNDHLSFDALHALSQHGQGQQAEDKLHREAAKALGFDASTPEKLATYKQAMRDFAAAQYHNTQDYFKKKGITHLHLVRGMQVGQSGEYNQKARQVGVKLQPASSFSTNHDTAYGFAKSGSMFVVKVPVSQVLGSYLTGFGCSNEHEVVVLAHKEMQAVQVGKANASAQSSMVQHIQEALETHTFNPKIAATGSPAVAHKATKAPAVKDPATGKAKKLPKPTEHGFASAAHLGTLAKKVHAAGKAGDLTQLKALYDKAKASTGVPKTTALAESWMKYHELL